MPKFPSQPDYFESFRAMVLWWYLRKKWSDEKEHEKARKQLRSDVNRNAWYRIIIRTEDSFVAIQKESPRRFQNLERIWGQLPDGRQDVHALHIHRNAATVTAQGYLEITDRTVRAALRGLNGRIIRVNGDVFRMRPRLRTSRT